MAGRSIWWIRGVRTTLELDIRWSILKCNYINLIVDAKNIKKGRATAPTGLKPHQVIKIE
jgi:hypothetical protein